jgi:hypothetical protein
MMKFTTLTTTITAKKNNFILIASEAVCLKLMRTNNFYSLGGVMENSKTGRTLF